MYIVMHALLLVGPRGVHSPTTSIAQGAIVGLSTLAEHKTCNPCNRKARYIGRAQRAQSAILPTRWVGHFLFHTEVVAHTGYIGRAQRAQTATLQPHGLDWVLHIGYIGRARVHWQSTTGYIGRAQRAQSAILPILVTTWAWYSVVATSWSTPGKVYLCTLAGHILDLHRYRP